MTLGDLLERVRTRVPFRLEGAATDAALAVEVGAITHDSRKATRGAIFTALRGLKADGASFAESAARHGAIATVAETSAPVGWTAPWVVVPNARAALSWLAAALNDFPSRSLKVVGVTGTNGKTTTTYLLTAIFERAGFPCGRIGTVGYALRGAERPASHTTPEADLVQSLLREMVDQGARACAMEVSSHALTLNRVDAVEFAAGVFTNLTRDHLDFHGDMEAYFQAKSRLFELLPAGAPAVVNVDDPAGRRLAAMLPSPVTYGLQSGADVTFETLSLTMEGVSGVVRTPRQRVELMCPLPGRPNAYNVLAAFAVGEALGLPPAALVAGLGAVSHVPGRFQVVSTAGDDVRVIVDYAHTDDALRNVLETVRPLAARQVIVVFGCGGDRDKTKRPLMGAVAARLSDLVVLTSDNPRTEDPDAIIEDITRGIVVTQERTNPRVLQAPVAVRGTPWVAIADRRAAIVHAVSQAQPGDTIVVAGKGHETYQLIGTREVPFDDVAVAREALASRRARSKVS